MPDPRLQAALILQEVLEQQVFTKDAKQRFPVDSEMDSAFVNMLLQTTLRDLVYAKKILKNFVKKKLPSSSKLGNYILYLGVAEILYMNTPDYAVINSYVNIAKKELDKYVAGFINAVLRKVCANKKTFAEEDTGEFFPQEFRRLLNNSYSKKTINAIEKARDVKLANLIYALGIMGMIQIIENIITVALAVNTEKNILKMVFQLLNGER